MATAEDYFKLPETNQFVELNDGEIIASGSRELAHQVILRDMITLISKLRSDGEVFLPPVAVYLDDYNVVEPDILWISPERRHIVTETHVIAAPDFAVEIFSPFTKKRDKTIKFHLYQTHGVRELWYADREAEYLEVWSLLDGEFQFIGVFGAGETFESPLLGKSVDVRAIFPPDETTMPE